MTASVRPRDRISNPDVRRRRSEPGSGQRSARWFKEHAYPWVDARCSFAVLALLTTSCIGAQPPATSQPVALVEPPPAARVDVAASDAKPVVETPAAPASSSEPDPPPVPAPSTSTISAWAQNVRPTALRSGPAGDALPFTTLPDQSYLKVLETRPDWLLVVYGGDGATRAPGQAWASAADVGPIGDPPRWVINYQATKLWPSADATDASYTSLPPWSFLELMDEEQNGRLLVRDSGDGRYRLPGQRWVDAWDVGPVEPPSTYDLPRGYPANAQPNALHLLVPYRSQLDGSPWAGANCGPATLGMGLEGLGIAESSAELRREVLSAQGLWGDDEGSYIWALAQVAEQYGARALDLHENDGELKRWSPDDIRRHVREGRPVIVQVRYRALPGRGDKPYYGDHYIIVTGLVGADFLYNDAIDQDGLGFDRLVRGAELERAMNAADRRYAYTGFALERR